MDDLQVVTYRYYAPIPWSITMGVLALLLLAVAGSLWLFRPRFSLKWLFWLVAVCAFTCWLLTLPPLFTSGFFEGHVVGTRERVAYAVPMNWPAEVSARVGLCIALFFVPMFFGRNRL
jgi:hypothetical protein